MRGLALVALLATAACAPIRLAPRHFDGLVYPYAKGTPLLLVHGAIIGDVRLSIGYAFFSGDTVRALRDAGFYVLLPALPAVAPPTERAAVLAGAIDRALALSGASQVILIAHSQAGVDARLLALDPTHRGKIAAIATLSSPHHGTPLAELGEQLRGGLFETLIERWSRRIAESRGWVGREGHSRTLMASLTAREMARLEPLGDGGVPLYSLAATPEPARDGSCDGGLWPPPAMRSRRGFVTGLLGALIKDARGPGHADDGVVPTDSQRFGRFLGCAPIDHAGWLQARAGRFETTAFLVELARALEEVARTGDRGAVERHAAALGALARPAD